MSKRRKRNYLGDKNYLRAFLAKNKHNHGMTVPTFDSYEKKHQVAEQSEYATSDTTGIFIPKCATTVAAIKSDIRKCLPAKVITRENGLSGHQVLHSLESIMCDDDWPSSFPICPLKSDRSYEACDMDESCRFSYDFVDQEEMWLLDPLSEQYQKDMAYNAYTFDRLFNIVSSMPSFFDSNPYEPNPTPPFV
jgi:hypothetical protein